MTEAGNEVVIPGEAVHGDQSASALAPVETRWLEVWLPILIIVVDQMTKALVRTRIPLYASITIVPGFLNLTHVLNTGAAFGILNASDFPFKTVVIAIIATVGPRSSSACTRPEPGSSSARRTAGAGADHRWRRR